MEQRTKRPFMERDTVHDQDSAIPGNHGMMTGGPEPDLDQQAHIKIDTGAGPDLGEGAVMTRTIRNSGKS